MTAIAGTSIAMNRSKSVPVILAGGAVGWIGGWLMQAGVIKAIDMIGERLPDEVIQPAFTGELPVPSIDSVMNKNKIVTEDEINSGPVVDIPSGSTDLKVVD